MKHISKIAIIVMIILSMLMISCTTNRGQYIQEDVYIGTEGLRAWFLERAPPREIYEGERFDAILKLHNVGAYDISEGYYSFGIETSYVGTIKPLEDAQVDSFNLRGRDEFDPYGKDTQIILNLKALNLDPQKERHTTTLTTNICYPYKTRASVDVCIDTDIYGQSQNVKSCTPAPKSEGRGQGGPISVTLVETKMLPHDDEDKVRPQFTIHIQNMGTGQVLAEEKIYEACTATGLEAKDLNRVKINAYLFQDQLYCTPKMSSADTGDTGSLKLEQDYDFAICTLKTGISKDRGTYTAPLRIDLGYGYTFSISKNIEILRQIRR